MNVEDRLACPGAGIHHHAVAVGQMMLARQLRGDTVQMAEQRLIGFIGLRRGDEMLAGDYQQVYRRLGIDVVKCDAGRVLVDDPGRSFSL